MHDEIENSMDFIQQDNDPQLADGTAPAPTPEITPEYIASIPTVVELETLIEDMRSHREVFELQDVARIHAERLEYLKQAARAPRCQHVKSSGVTCGSPAMKGQSFCYFHTQASTQTTQARPILELPVIEDERSLQIALMRVAQHIANLSLSPNRAKLLLQLLQIAGANLRNCTPPCLVETRHAAS